MTQLERITPDQQKELLKNVTRNTNFVFGTETIQTARNYQNISGHSKTATPILQLTGVFWQLPRPSATKTSGATYASQKNFT